MPCSVRWLPRESYTAPRTRVAASCPPSTSATCCYGRVASGVTSYGSPTLATSLRQGALPKSVLIGWLLEMYHYIRDFPGRHRARCCARQREAERCAAPVRRRGKGPRRIRSTDAGQPRPVQGRGDDQHSPAVHPAGRLSHARAVRAGAGLDAHGGCGHRGAGIRRSSRSPGSRPVCTSITTSTCGPFDPYFRHQEIDVSLGHAALLASNIDLVEINDAQVLDQVVNKIHDLKHAFDLQGIEIKAYYTTLNGKYLPRQPVTFESI
jgi:hypothetical protein